MIRQSPRHGTRFVLKGVCYKTKLEMIQDIMRKNRQARLENTKIKLLATIGANNRVTVHINVYEAIFTPKHFDIHYPKCKKEKVIVRGRFTVQCIEKVSSPVSESNNCGQIPKMPTSGKKVEKI